MRFLKEIYYAMRKQVGEDYPIFVKLTATEFFDGGQSFEDTKVICKEMEKIGIDAIELSGNVHGKAKSMVGQVFEGYEIEAEGYFYRYGEEISKEVHIPIITVGGLSHIERIDEILQNTNIQYFAIARPLLAEPHLVKRWKDGDRSAVKCIRCSKCRTSKGNYCIVFNRK